jgi:uncharacterized protein (DUF2252 family)
MGTVRSIEEQQAAGRQARKRVPRSGHADWHAAAGRDVVSILKESERDRIPELLPIRWERMAASPFGFFRGATAVMARDLAGRPDTGLIVQICGDAHVRNMGAFASPEGHLVFDINDFDETIRAPFEWDLLRFATSLVLAGREAGDTDDECLASTGAFVRSYREAVRAFAKLPYIDLLRIEVKRILTEKPIYRILRMAERATPLWLLAKITEERDSGERRFIERPPLLRRLAAPEAEKVQQSLAPYEETLAAEHRFALGHYRPVDFAFKVVGTGSVGVRDFVILMAGAAQDDVLFLQIKEEMQSCYAPYVDEADTHHGRRAATGQRLMQRATDPFLGWTEIDGRPFLVRQLNDHKAAVGPADLTGKPLVEYATVAGSVLARAHARTGESAALAAYCGKNEWLDAAITRFAIAYADQMVTDHARFVDAHRAMAVSRPVS